MPLIQQSGKTADAAARWLRWADQDYLAARSLLLRGFLVQGSGLSNTAIEKYLKTVLILKQVTFPRGWKGHDVVFLFEQLVGAGVDLCLNKDYLKILVKAYTMRYPDDLDPGFNIVLEQAKMLAELDANRPALYVWFGKFGMAENPVIQQHSHCFPPLSRKTVFSVATPADIHILSNGSPLTPAFKIPRSHRFPFHAPFHPEISKEMAGCVCLPLGIPPQESGFLAAGRLRLSRRTAAREMVREPAVLAQDGQALAGT